MRQIFLIGSERQNFEKTPDGTIKLSPARLAQVDPIIDVTLIESGYDLDGSIIELEKDVAGAT